MSLRALAAKAAASAFTAAGDIVTNGSLVRVVKTYDAATGSTSTTSASYNAPTIFSSFKDFEIDKITIVAGDVKAIILQARLAVAPLLTDSYLNATGRAHQVLGVMQDPAAATWTLHLRAVA